MRPRAAPLPFTLRQLQYALAVAESMSFSKAAALCHVTQPALSLQVAQMESALGLPLFERNRKRVLVTAAGQQLLDRAKRVLLEAEDLHRAARQSRDPLSGRIRIGVIPTVAPYLLPHLTAPLKQRFPRMSISWVEDKTAPLVQMLGAGTLEAALVAREADLGASEGETVLRDRFLLAVSAQHPLGRRRGPVSATELADEPLLLLDEGHCLREQALAFCARHRLKETDLRATSLSTLVQMVIGGAGATLLPRLALATETQRAALRCRPFRAPHPERTIALIWRHGSPLRPSLTRLAEAMREAARGGIR